MPDALSCPLNLSVAQDQTQVGEASGEEVLLDGLEEPAALFAPSLSGEQDERHVWSRSYPRRDRADQQHRFGGRDAVAQDNRESESVPRTDRGFERPPIQEFCGAQVEQCYAPGSRLSVLRQDVDAVACEPFSGVELAGCQ